ncbi:hypothetical protein Hanom_Chr08g00717681 [Helianthus anomalus]
MELVSRQMDLHLLGLEHLSYSPKIRALLDLVVSMDDRIHFCHS